MKYMTIVIEYEGEIPVKGFGELVAGCKVSAIALGDYLEKHEKLERKLEKKRDKKLSRIG